MVVAGGGGVDMLAMGIVPALTSIFFFHVHWLFNLFFGHVVFQLNGI